MDDERPVRRPDGPRTMFDRLDQPLTDFSWLPIVLSLSLI